MAITTDVDETVLDNSPFFGKLIELNENFSKERWIEWGKQIKVKAVPGALAFLQYAASKDVEIFYLSNRYNIQVNETIDNLKKIVFPNANLNHICLKIDESVKTS